MKKLVLFMVLMSSLFSFGQEYQINLLGHSMFKAETEEQLDFHISSVSQGTYFLKVVINNGAADTFRLLKN